MSKAVSLTVHKNTAEGRAKRSLAKTVGRAVEAMIRENDIRCLAFIGIASDGRGFSRWDTGGIIPLYGFVETIKAVLEQSVDGSNVREDYAAPMRGGFFKQERN